MEYSFVSFGVFLQASAPKHKSSGKIFFISIFSFLMKNTEGVTALKSLQEFQTLFITQIFF
jgi:hypothetical protein